MAFKNLTERFRYGGDISTYRSKLLQIIHGKKYYTGYPGGPTAFLNTWEEAAVRYNKVAEPASRIHSDQLIDYLSGKLKVINDTEHIVEQVKDTITTFEEMTSKLREKFAQRDYLAQTDKQSKIHANAVGTQQLHEKEFMIAQLYINAVNANNPEWRVGRQLWNILTPEQQKTQIDGLSNNQTEKKPEPKKPPKNDLKYDTVTSIVKKPSTTQKEIPRQYNSNKTSFDWESEETETSLLQEMTGCANLQEAYTLICKANDSS